MSVFTHKEFDDHEQVSFFTDPHTGLRAIIAVHNTNLGPALGGCRMWAYENDDLALTDVLRLSRGMSYKAAISGVPLGGGKSVIIGDSRKIKTPELMRAMGRAVDTFGGRYIVAEDVGTSVEDMNNIHRETDHVVGISDKGEGSGDPSPTTAYGVYVGFKSAVRHRLGKDSVKGLKVAVQGLGNVGYNLCKHLHEDGAELFVTDVQTDRIDMAVTEMGATPVGLHDIYGMDVDVFAPCALGGILNDDTIPLLKAKVVAGAANNQLAEARHGDMLRDLNVLYAPDYVINAGGLINVYYEYLARKGGKAYDRAGVMAHVEQIDATATRIFDRAEKEGICTAMAADQIAELAFKEKKNCKAA
ncbi:MAG: amino acid dehydrogenase [Alphaproteobacteria bacterium]|nr:amino acid dehydrogenase [Alphaproteobacteria bacterium]